MANKAGYTKASHDDDEARRAAIPIMVLISRITLMTADGNCVSMRFGVLRKVVDQDANISLREEAQRRINHGGKCRLMQCDAALTDSD